MNEAEKKENIPPTADEPMTESRYQELLFYEWVYNNLPPNVKFYMERLGMEWSIIKRDKQEFRGELIGVEFVPIEFEMVVGKKERDYIENKIIHEVLLTRIKYIDTLSQHYVAEHIEEPLKPEEPAPMPEEAEPD